MLAACAEARDADTAFRTLKEMAGSGAAPPDVKSYTRLLRACGVSTFRQAATAPADFGDEPTAPATLGGLDTATAAVVAELTVEQAATGSAQSDAEFISTMLDTLEKVKALKVKVTGLAQKLGQLEGVK
jgi:hypothetical protein